MTKSPSRACSNSFLLARLCAFPWRCACWIRPQSGSTSLFSTNSCVCSTNPCLDTFGSSFRLLFSPQHTPCVLLSSPSSRSPCALTSFSCISCASCVLLSLSRSSPPSPSARSVAALYLLHLGARPRTVPPASSLPSSPASSSFPNSSSTQSAVSPLTLLFSFPSSFPSLPSFHFFFLLSLCACLARCRYWLLSSCRATVCCAPCVVETRLCMAKEAHYSVDVLSLCALNTSCCMPS